MAAETNTFAIKIGDDNYDIPLLDDFDMDEWEILHDYSGLLQEDFAPAVDRAEEDIDRAAAEDRAAKGETEDEKLARLSKREKELRAHDGPIEKERLRRISHPSFTKARLHIGYRRMHPDVPADEIRAMVGKVKRIKYYEAMLDTVLAEDEENTDTNSPPASTPELEPSSQEEPGKTSGDESPTSQKSSGLQVVPAAATGTSG